MAFSLYLAGFDVFRPDAVAYGESLKAMCAQYGLEGLYPLDNSAPPHLSGRALADWIYRGNIKLIERADGVMANLNPFRGAEPDSGTAFEVGYAIALNKPVWAYTAIADSIVEQVAECQASDGGHPRHVDANGYTVEDFGMNLNLMLACSASIVIGDAGVCLERIAREAGASSP
jgi:nucleoside 2-deoxyribosyltransferase